MSISGIKPLFTAVATATGGRNGHSAAEDGSVAVDLSVPKAMGGPGKPNTTTPEHLFATGYAACFGGALDFVATQKKRNAKGAAVTCSVSIGPRDAGGFGISVKLHVVDPRPAAGRPCWLWRRKRTSRSVRTRMPRAAMCRSISPCRAADGPACAADAHRPSSRRAAAESDRRGIWRPAVSDLPCGRTRAADAAGIARTDAATGIPPLSHRVGRIHWR